MASVMDIYRYIDSIAAFSIQEGFDNAGFLVGYAEKRVGRILVALDITTPVIREAAELGAELIVAHHPVIFTPLTALTDQDPASLRVLQLAEHHIAAICAHTNLDAVQDGVNDVLARVLGLEDIRLLCQSGVDTQGRPYGIGRIGTINTDVDSLPAFAAFVKDKLCAGCVRYHDAGRPVSRVAVGGGACGSMLAEVVAAGCDTFVTSDIKHSDFLNAADLGLNLVDAGHFATENVICDPLVQRLRLAFPDIQVMISRRSGEVFSCFS